MVDNWRGQAGTTAAGTGPAAPADRTNEYRGRDLHAEGVWEMGSKPRYGMVAFNPNGEVLLREPANHFDGFVWTFYKGATDKNEHTVETALRETLEETGHRPVLIGHLDEGFRGGRTGSLNFYYLGFHTTGQVDRSAMDRNGETWSTAWVSVEEARDRIARSTNKAGRDRDLRTLEAAALAFAELQGSAD
jgi:8-oxo-dGTP pyrophosphatase MutT (NUDIX family)